MSGEKSLMSGVVGIVSGQERINSHFFLLLITAFPSGVWKPVEWAL